MAEYSKKITVSPSQKWFLISSKTDYGWGCGTFNNHRFNSTLGVSVRFFVPFWLLVLTLNNFQQTSLKFVMGICGWLFSVQSTNFCNELMVIIKFGLKTVLETFVVVFSFNFRRYIIKGFDRVKWVYLCNLYTIIFSMDWKRIRCVCTFVHYFGKIAGWSFLAVSVFAQQKW